MRGLSPAPWLSLSLLALWLILHGSLNPATVAVGAVVGAAASVEPSGWQAVRAVDSISTARAAPAFRAVRGIGLMGCALLAVSGSSSVVLCCLPRAGSVAGGATPHIRLMPADRLRPGRAPAVPGRSRR